MSAIEIVSIFDLKWSFGMLIKFIYFPFFSSSVSQQQYSPSVYDNETTQQIVPTVFEMDSAIEVSVLSALAVFYIFVYSTCSFGFLL